MELPPSEVLVAIVRRYALLVADHGDELGTRSLVLPTPQHFPDRFTGDEASARRLVARMQRHAGLEDVPVDVQIAADDDAPATASCASGACSTPSAPPAGPGLTDQGDGWLLTLPAAVIRSPVGLTTHVARVLAVVFLLETTEEARLEQDADVQAELAATALGFGPLLLAGSYVYSKSCGGPSVAKLTTLSTAELAVACALFAHAGGHKVRAALGELEATQRELLAEADEWAASNAAIVDRLRRDPRGLAKGEIRLAETKPWFLRMFGRRASPPRERNALADPDASLEELEAMASAIGSRPGRAEPADPATAELRSLVTEALAESRAAQR